MIVTVRHLTKEAFKKVDFLETNLLDFVKDELKHNNLIRVADLRFSEINNQTLEDAYRLTNSIDSLWFKNPEIDVEKSAKDGCRSTSVGDVIQIKGISYMVDSCGFTEIK